MKILIILTLILMFSLIGVVVAGWLRKRRINEKTAAIGTPLVTKC
jgi:hypothetical protein